MAAELPSMLSSSAWGNCGHSFNLKIKKGISLTPLNCALNALIFALNDSANAFVSLLTK